jgi:hypothetical protein
VNIKSLFVQKNRTDHALSKKVVIDIQMQKAVMLEKNGRNWTFISDVNFNTLSLTETEKTISNWVKKYDLFSIPCVLLLPFSETQITLCPMPNVLKQEISAALKWKISEYTETPVTEITWDYIELPNIRDKEDKFCYLVMSNLSVVEKWENLAEDCGLILDAVDTSVSSLFSLINKTEHPRKGQALVWLSKELSYIVIIKDKLLYMARELDFKFNSSNTQALEDLSLEIQRSLDYCATRYQNISIVDCKVLSESELSIQNYEWLQSELTCEISGFEWKNLCKGIIDRQEFISNMFSLGCVMAHYDETKD